MLTTSATHAGNFTFGQASATYTIAVSNTGSATTSGALTVTDTVPAGLSLVDMSGTGWSCSGNVCTRSDALAANSSYATITVTVNVASEAPPQVTNVVTTSGGGVPASTIEDPTFVGAATPVLQISAGQAGNFTAGQLNAKYIVAVGNQTAAAATGGAVAVAETLPSGWTLVSMAGNGWTCSGASCTRNDPLAGGANYPPIVVTADITANTSLVTNQMTLSGGGSASASFSLLTTVSPFTCDLNGDGVTNVADVQLIINQALGLIPAVNDLNHDGLVNVVDVQKEINAALGQGCPY